MSTFRNFTKISRHFCTKTEIKPLKTEIKPPQRHVQVCILGAEVPTGQALSFLLKQNPNISGLHLQGTARIEHLGLDLDHFDTRCRVRTYFDADSMSNSVKSADIIVMLGVNTAATKMSLPKLVMAEATRVLKLTDACVKYAPKAIVLVAVTPVSVFLPVVAEVYKQSDWYHPGRLLGCTAFAQIKANSIAANYQTLEPQIIHVPIIGGPDLDCAIPLFSQTIPVGIPMKDSKRLFEEFRKDSVNIGASHAVGLNRTISEIAKGLNGDYNANMVAYIRTNIVSTCKHLVCIVKMGTHGVFHNYGLQKLHRNELMLFEETCLELKAREEMASDLVHREDKCSLPTFMIREMEQEKSEKLGIIR